MARLEIRPFSAEFVPAAGDLLAERHRTHRTAEPLLPERYEDPAAAAAEIEALAGSEHASGSVALRGGRVVGYLLGIRKDDGVWGPNVWVESAGHAVAEAEDLRDLYGAAAERWFEEGRARHYAMYPASEAGLIDAWWRVSFGLQHALGIREVPDLAWPENVRRANEDDLDALVELSPVLPDHQERAPVCGRTGRPRQTEDELRADLLEDAHRQLPPVASGAVRLGERQRQPAHPAFEEHPDRARAQPIADRLQRSGIGAGAKPVGQLGELDAGLGALAFGPFVAVEPHLDGVREVGADLDERRTESASQR